MSKIFTSESVALGHPDKVCDFVADSILDEILSQDKKSHVACEVTACRDFMHIMGEITTNAEVDYESVARKAIREIGYTKNEYGFTDNCKIKVDIQKQSNDINMGVSQKSGEIGAGDQGIMFGYACSQTTSLMPYCITKAHELTKKLKVLRENKVIPYLRPDGKSQVTAEFDDDEKVKRISSVVISAQSDDDVNIEQIRSDIKEKLIIPTFDRELLKDTKYYIKPTGRFVLGGPAGDSGLTGRKIIVDTYGGSACHGGGAFAGKDPTKVDRSISYMLRRIAKSIVASLIAKVCEIQASYSIGIAEPLSVNVRTFGTSKISDEKLVELIKSHYDLRPKAVIEFLDLEKPIYAVTNDGGAFGNDNFKATWEEVDSL